MAKPALKNAWWVTDEVQPKVPESKPPQKDAIASRGTDSKKATKIIAKTKKATKKKAPKKEE